MIRPVHRIRSINTQRPTDETECVGPFPTAPSAGARQKIGRVVDSREPGHCLTCITSIYLVFLVRTKVRKALSELKILNIQEYFYCIYDITIYFKKFILPQLDEPSMYLSQMELVRPCQSSPSQLLEERRNQELYSGHKVVCCTIGRNPL